MSEHPPWKSITKLQHGSLCRLADGVVADPLLKRPEERPPTAKFLLGDGARGVESLIQAVSREFELQVDVNRLPKVAIPVIELRGKCSSLQVDFAGDLPAVLTEVFRCVRA